MDSHRYGKRGWGESTLGAVPFLVFGLLVAPYGLWFGWTTFWPLAVGYLVLLFGLGAGWVKGFPRWSYPYLGSVLILTVYWTDVSTPGVTLLGHTFRRSELWGWRAWIPFSAMAAMALLLTRSPRPLLRLFTGIWQDWTLLSFMLYGLMPWAVWVSYDEVNSSCWFPSMMAAMLLLTAGALVYMRQNRTAGRLLALLGGLGLAWGCATASFFSDRRRGERLTARSR